MSGQTNQGRAQQYLEDKYGESFKLYSFINDSIDQIFREYYFETEAFPGQIVKVIEDADGFRDNYYGILVKEDYRAMVQPVWDKYLPDGKVFFHFTGAAFPEALDHQIRFDRALRDYEEAFAANFFLFTDGDSLTEDVWQELVGELTGLHVHGIVNCYKVEAAELAALSEETYSAYLSANYQLRPVRHSVIG